MSQREISRRGFLIASTGIVAATSVAISPAFAADGQRLDPNSPSAVALGYVTNHQRVDTKRWPKKASAQGADARCADCALFTGNGGQGPCRIFKGQLVAANGWCNAWTKG